MDRKLYHQHKKLLEDRLTLTVWFEKEFKDKLGMVGYQDLVDSILDEILELRKELNEK